MERLGTVIALGNDFQEAVSHVQLVDELGYESAWITDGIGRDAFVVLTAFASATAQITLGTSIVTFYPRHPTVMARQALSLDEVSGGRFVLGIGTGHRSSMETQLGYTSFFVWCCVATLPSFVAAAFVRIEPGFAKKE